MMLLAFSCLTLFVGVVGWRFYRKLEYEVTTRFSNHQWDIPSKLYAASTLLYPGFDVSAMGLLDLLNRMDYRSVDKTVQASGEYFYDPPRNVLQIFLHDLPASSGMRRQPRRVNMKLLDGRIEKLTDLDEDKDLRGLELDPEIITSLYDQSWEERRIVKLYEVPSLLVKALLAAETNGSLSMKGLILTHPWRWLANFAGRTTRRRTLTQQLVKISSSRKNEHANGGSVYCSRP
jgi:penicillin-binding protein 1B